MKKSQEDFIEEQQDSLELKLTTIFSKVQALDANMVAAKELGDAAKERAESVQTGLFKSKNKALENLKDVAIMNADTTIATLEVVDQIAENQRKMALVCEDFIKLGVVDIASNRAVIEFIKKVMSGEEAKSLTEETLAQLTGVIRDLQQKEDILSKQRKQGSKINDHEKRIVRVENLTDCLDKELGSIKEIDKQREAVINKHQKKDIEQDRRLDAGDAKDKSQDALLEEQMKVDLRHDEQIQSLNSRIDALEHDIEILKRNKRLQAYFSFSVGIGIIGVILGIFNILR